MNNFLALSSLAMDLDRVAIGLHRNSNIMAQRFIQEARKRKKEIDTTTIKPYISELLEKMEYSFQSTDSKKKAEDALMYSTLFKNASLELKNS